MKNTSSARTVGLDLGDRKHVVCVLDAKGDVLKEEVITNTRPSLTALSKRHARCVITGAARVPSHRENYAIT